MLIFSSPLQGYTDRVWRSAHAHWFGGVDYYFSPFMRVERGAIRRRDLADAATPDDCFVPQILGGRPAEVVMMATALRDMGHRHVNINMSCPFKPLVMKTRGAGLLASCEAVTAMVDALRLVDNVSYSVKMRLGVEDDTQWRQVLPLLEPLKPLWVAIHPRTVIDQYSGELRNEQVEQFITDCPYPLVFNGEIKDLDDLRRLGDKFPQLHAAMIGRGLVENPDMMLPAKATPDVLLGFHNELLEGYSNWLTGGEHQLLTRMKSLWEIFMPDAPRKARKAIKKSRNMEQYNAAVDNLLSEAPFIPDNC